MSEKQSERHFVVFLHRPMSVEDIEKMEKRLSDKFGATVIVVDCNVSRVEEL